MKYSNSMQFSWLDRLWSWIDDNPDRRKIKAMEEYGEKLDEVIQNKNNEVLMREEEKVGVFLEMKNIYEKYSKDGDEFKSAEREYKHTENMVNNAKKTREECMHLRRVNECRLSIYKDKFCVSQLSSSKFRNFELEDIKRGIDRLNKIWEARETEIINVEQTLESENKIILGTSFEEISMEEHNRYVEEVKKFIEDNRGE